MPFELDDRLVVGIASSALFDLSDSDEVFRTQGEAAYRRYQEEHLNDTLEPGEAFPFIRRLLSLNDLAVAPDDPLVEVIVLSRNDPDTGLRVMKSIQAHCLPITRAVFMQGRSPHKFMPAFNMSLFLSASADAVREAVGAGLPAGQVLPSAVVEEDDSGDLRIAFDFDGVLADDASEGVMQAEGLPAFHAHEVANLATPHSPGPLKPFLEAINRIQEREQARLLEDPQYRIRVHVAIVTARNAPSHERAMSSLKEWGVRVNDAFFLGGVEKARVLEILKPHIFFDDQVGHLAGAAKVAPSVHVPFGIVNAATPSPSTVPLHSP